MCIFQYSTCVSIYSTTFLIHINRREWWENVACCSENWNNTRHLDSNLDFPIKFIMSPASHDFYTCNGVNFNFVPPHTSVVGIKWEGMKSIQKCKNTHWLWPRFRNSSEPAFHKHAHIPTPLCRGWSTMKASPKWLRKKREKTGKSSNTKSIH